MKLEAYLREHDLTPAAFAGEIGVSRTAVDRYVTGDRRPRPEVLSKIMEKTGGKVQPNDFFAPGAASAHPGEAA